MKEYEIIPKRWDKKTNDFASDFDNTEYTVTYAKAVKKAKGLSKDYDRVDIEFYKLNRAGYTDDEDFMEEWTYNRSGCLQWTESYEKGKQRPVVFIGGTPIWRWNMQGFPEDLKPRKEANHDRA